MIKSKPSPDAHTLSEILRLGPSILFHFSYPDLRCIYISPHVTDLLGYPTEAWVTKPLFWQNHIHPEDKDGIIDTYSHLVPSTTPTSFDYRMKHKDGHYLWVRNRIKLVVMPDASLRICGGMINVTKEKIQEFKTERLMNRYRTMLSSLHEGVMLVDQQGNVLECNQSAAEMMGTSQDLLRKANTFRFPLRSFKENGEEYAIDDLPINKTIKTGIAITGAIIGVQLPHKREWFAVNTRRIPTQDFPSPEGSLITFTNITKAIESRRLLEESERRYKTISEMTSDFIFFVRVDSEDEHHLVWTSGSLQSLLEVPDSTHIDLPYGYVARVHPDDRSVFTAAMRPLYKNKSVANIHRIMTPSGIKWMECHLSPIYSRSEKRVTHLIGSIKDITALKEAETTLHDLSQEIINTQEKERNMLARELHDNVGQAAPSILLHLKNIQRIHNDPETRAIVNTAEAELRQMNESIRFIHSWLEPKTLNVLGLPAAIHELVTSMGEAAKITTEVAVEGLTKIRDIESHIHILRLVQEAVRNAVKHASATHISVKTRLHQDHLHLWISDNGRGFTRNTFIKGHYGLSIMEERANLIGGRIEVNSKPNQGTTVLISIPLA